MTDDALNWTGSQPLAGSPRRPVVVLLTFTAILAAMMISPFLLDYYGIPYSASGGNPLLKIHPMTYLAILAFMAACISYGNPLSYVAVCVSKFPGTAYFLIILAVMIAWTLLIQHQPLTALVDTFLPAALFIFLIGNLPPRLHRWLTVLIHLIMTANALIGIAEVTTGWRLTPFSVNGSIILWDWRASAILGHPLENAMVTGVYLLMILFGADRNIKHGLRVAIIVLQMMGLFVFGGRTAMVIAYGIVAIRCLVYLFGLIRGKTFDPRIAALVVMILPPLIGAILVSYDLGVFDKMIERFTNDGGSADTRVSILRIFNSFPLYDLLMGPDPDVLVAKTYIEGTIAGIESFVFGFFLQSGMIISIIFFIGLGAISLDLWRVGSRASLLHIVFFYVVAAGAASLSVKGQAFAQFVILFMTVESMPSLLDREPDRSAAIDDFVCL